MGHRLSSRWTLFRRWLGGFVRAIPIVFLVWYALEDIVHKGELLFGLAVLFLCFWWTAKDYPAWWHAWNTVDEVWDFGDSLLIRKRRKEARFKLAEVSFVEVDFRRIAIGLRVPSDFGQLITFVPPFRLPLSTNRTL